jgi:purine-nucleoside phosphorylase
MWNKVQETVKYIKSQGVEAPFFGIVLGTGLGSLVNHINIIKSIDYHDIPNFPISTVKGHSGKLIYGELGGKKVLAMQGRFHYYEGWTMQQATFPIRVMKYLGIDNIIVSNASGGVNQSFSVGDIMLITDHINFMPEHPLHGHNNEKFGQRFVDMHEPYSIAYQNKFKKIAQEKKIPIQQGVYLALQGPTFETPAEYKMVRILGADAVGMSTVPEVIVAKHMNMKCLGISVITDMGIEGKPEAVSHEEVQLAAKKSEKDLSDLVTAFIASF